LGGTRSGVVIGRARLGQRVHVSDGHRMRPRRDAGRQRGDRDGPESSGYYARSLCQTY